MSDADPLRFKPKLDNFDANVSKFLNCQVVIESDNWNVSFRKDPKTKTKTKKTSTAQAIMVNERNQKNTFLRN